MEYQPIRINKYLSTSGYCSRRAADTLVTEGRVKIDGITAMAGSKVLEGQQVTVDNRVMNDNIEPKVYSFYKPVGVISSMSDSQGKSLASYVNNGIRLFPVGRLDKDSEGLMLLTNDGELMNSVLKAANGHEKEYLVTVDKVITDEFIDKMCHGVPITNASTGEKVITAECRITKMDDHNFRIILIQGLNRQIRRMCGYFDYKVTNLKRIRIMNIDLTGLHMGEMAEITGERLQKLKVDLWTNQKESKN